LVPVPTVGRFFLKFFFWSDEDFWGMQIRYEKKNEIENKASLFASSKKTQKLKLVVIDIALLLVSLRSFVLLFFWIPFIALFSLMSLGFVFFLSELYELLISIELHMLTVLKKFENSPSGLGFWFKQMQITSGF
jgi:hypothetical protein